MNHRVGKAEPDIGGGGRGAGFTDQNGTSAAVASPPREPRTPLNARVHAYSADQVSESVQAPDGNGNPAGTEVLESSTTSNAATRWPNPSGVGLWHTPVQHLPPFHIHLFAHRPPNCPVGPPDPASILSWFAHHHGSAPGAPWTG